MKKNEGRVLCKDLVRYVPVSTWKPLQKHTLCKVVGRDVLVNMLLPVNPPNSNREVERGKQMPLLI